MPLFDRPPIDAISVSDALFSSGTFRITGGPGIVVGSDASGASISAGLEISYFDNMGAGTNATAAQGVQAYAPRSVVLQPLTPYNEVFPGVMTVSTMMLNMSWASFTNTNSAASTGAYSSSFQVGVYTMVNSTQLTLINSANSSFTKAAASANSTLYSGAGPRWVTFDQSLWSSTPVFTPGRYWFGVNMNTSSNSIPGSSVGQWMFGTNQRFGTFGSSNVTATSMKHFPFLGVLSNSTSGMPGSIAASAVMGVQASAGWVPHVVFNNRASAI